MLHDVPAEVCVINASEQTILGRLRDGRSRSVVVTAGNGARSTAREPVWQAPLPRLSPGETNCIPVSASTLVGPRLNLWTETPLHLLPNGREDYSDCRLPRALAAGGRLTFTYRAGLLGGVCRATEAR